MSNFIDLITAGFIFLGGGTGTVITKHLLDKKKRVDSNIFQEGVHSMNHVYDCLNDVVEKTPCSRAMILYSQNGGGIPKGSSDLFVTVSHEIHKNSPSIRKDIQKFPVDHAYIQMLSSLLGSRNQCLLIQTDFLPHSLLRDIYTKSDIKQSLVYVLQKRKNKFIYCSFNFKQSEQISPQHERRCSLEAAKIKQIMVADDKRIKSWWKK